MAGIGFELRKITSDSSFFSLVRANFYSSILSSGAWVISISILVAIYFYLSFELGPKQFCVQFLVAVSYIVSSSLILSAIFQHCVNRFIADKIFEEAENLIMPALFSSSLILLILSLMVGVAGIELLIPNQPLLIKLLMQGSFSVLNLIWLFSNSLTGLKNYRFIMFSYCGSYLLVFLMATWLYPYKLAGLLFAFYTGHVVLLLLFFIFTLNNYPSKELFNRHIFDFMKSHKFLLLSGVFFQLGVWVDKYLFWVFDMTSLPVLESIRSSPVYDMPMFIAFLIMIPGLSILFYEIEANFSRFYNRYYDGIRDGATIREINKKHIEMVAMARTCFYNIFKVQLLVAVIACLFAPELFNWIGIGTIYVFLFRLDVVSACLLVLLISQTNVLYYLDNSRDACYTAAVFVIANVIFTLLSIYLGPLFFGYGFALALVCANLFAVFCMVDAFKKLTFTSFMSI